MLNLNLSAESNKEKVLVSYDDLSESEVRKTIKKVGEKAMSLQEIRENLAATFHNPPGITVNFDTNIHRVKVLMEGPKKTSVINETISVGKDFNFGEEESAQKVAA